MFSIVSKNLDGSYNVLDSEDNVVDAVSIDLFELLIGIGVNIQGVRLVDGSIVFDDVPLEKPEEAEEEFFESEEFEDNSEGYEEDSEEDFEAMFEDETNEEEQFEEQEEENQEYYEDDFLDSDDLEELFYGDGDTVNLENMYRFIPSNLQPIISEYYKWYTVQVYKKFKSDIHLEVSAKKARDLIKLRGNTTWEFGGIQDTGEMGNSCCELGHQIRYEYYAVAPNGDQIIFGEKCASDFFNISDRDMKELVKIRKSMCAEVLKIARQLYDDAVKDDYKDLEFFYSVMDRIDDNNLYDTFYTGRLGYFLKKFVTSGIPVPKSMVKTVKEMALSDDRIPDYVCKKINPANYRYQLYCLYPQHRDVLEEILKYNDFNTRTFKAYLEFMFSNWIDGIYAYNPIRKTGKEEGSFSRTARNEYIRKLSSFKVGLLCKAFTLEEMDNLIELYVECYNLRKELYDAFNRPINVSNSLYEEMKSKDRMIAEMFRAVSSTGGLYTAGDLKTSLEMLKKFKPSIMELYYKLNMQSVEDEPQGNDTPKKNEQKNTGEVNNRYTALERPDLFRKFKDFIEIVNTDKSAKAEVELRCKVSIAIVETALKNKWVSDKQLLYINRGITALESKGYM